MKSISRHSLGITLAFVVTVLLAGWSLYADSMFGLGLASFAATVIPLLVFVHHLPRAIGVETTSASIAPPASTDNAPRSRQVTSHAPRRDL